MNRGYFPWLMCLVATLAIVAGGLVSATFAGPVTIDDFTTPSPIPGGYIIGFTSPNPTTEVDSGPGILNNPPTVPIGERTLTAIVTTLVGPISAEGTIGGGDYTFGTVDAAAKASLVYSGPGSTPLGGVDLTGGGTNKAIDLSFAFIDSAASPYIVADVIATGPTGTAKLLGVHLPLLTAPGVDHLLLSSFSVTSGTFSFTKVDKLEFDFNSTAIPNVDFKLTGITATLVPEPAGLVAGVLGGALVLACCLIEGMRRKPKAVPACRAHKRRD